jgi:HK97 family phage prohead protease
MIPLVSSNTFKSMVATRTADRRIVMAKRAPLVGVVKSEVIEPVEKLDDRTLRFVISTGSVDRDQDRIDQSGWVLDHFAKNPVVLWGHNASMPPIGKALDVGVKNGRLTSAVRFLPDEGYGTASAWADQIYKLAKDGWLSATSVGFRPLKWDFTDDPERGADDWFPGIDFHSSELVELSLVTVPANPEALIEEPVATDEGTTATVAAFDTGRGRRARAAAVANIFPRRAIR